MCIFLNPKAGESDDASAPKGPRDALGAPSPKLGVVGDVTTSFSSSSTSLCIGPESTLPEPKGLELAPKGLVKPALDISPAYSSNSSVVCVQIGIVNDRTFCQFTDYHNKILERPDDIKW
jgi:hypothetical protein